MTLQITEDQQRLRDAADRMLAARTAPATLRTLFTGAGAAGFSHDLWRTLGELGWCGALVEERWGGSAQTLFDAGLLSEALGGQLALAPFIETAAIAALALQRGAGAALRETLLPRLARGELVVALTVDETAKHDPRHHGCRCEHHGDHYILRGRKRFVMHAADADYLLVAASDQWLLVTADAPGIAMTPHRQLDGSIAAEVAFEAVTVAPDAMLRGGEGFGDRLLDAGRALIAAELVGLADAALRRTLGYLRERRQFGRPIGSFQALQHRAAALYAEIELARALNRAALRAQDNGDERAALLTSAAKAKAAATALRTTAEAVQLHGGFGMTDECDIGLFLKRAAVLKEYLGDEFFHADRVARLIGY